jgi:hypothetical protein
MDVASSLTARGRKILCLVRLLCHHRVLTTSQLHAMFFGDLNTV